MEVGDILFVFLTPSAPEQLLMVSSWFFLNCMSGAVTAGLFLK